MSTAPSLHRCSICSKCFKRREHLQRHSGSHSIDRPHRCTSCNGTFQRADVLKRHIRTCDGKVNRSYVSSARRRACDRCVHQKKACSFSQPCQNCQRKAAPCNYSFYSNAEVARCDLPGEITMDRQDRALVLSDVDRVIAINPQDRQFEDSGAYTSNDFPDSDLFNNLFNSSWLDFVNLMSEAQPHLEPCLPYMCNYDYHFHFLDKFTSRTGLVSSFDCGSMTQRQQVVSAFFQSEAVCELATSQTMLSDIPLLPGVLDEQLDFITGNMNANPPLGGTSLVQSSWLYDPLGLKTHHIILLVKEVVTIKQRNSAVTLSWSPVLEQKCLEFFSPSNIRKFLELYWAIWHPNVNFVHRPTFDPTKCKSILLASMALIGACVSPDPLDNEQAKTWFNCVEEMVFTDDEFCSDSPSTLDTPSVTPSTNWRKTQALQAAYIVCLYQNWEGTDASKRRIRRYRFSTIVSVVRDIGIPTAMHLNYSRHPLYEFSWNEFVAREELIRTFLWIFLLDTAFVIFNNLPTRMVIKEMKMQMASPEACFQAATAEDCAEQIQCWMLNSNPVCSISLRSAVENVCRDTLAKDMCQNFARLGPLNLFAIVSAFHSLIFQYQNSFGGEGQLIPIRNALCNWKEIWEVYSHELSFAPPYSMVDNETLTPQNMWKRIGFMRHSPEFWLLASLIMDQISALDAQQQQVSNVGFGQSSVKLLDDGPPDPILNKYDQTSMRQVNDLIAAFQKVQIQE